MAISTLALRFRDLTTTDTLGRHRAIIEKHDYVWWGWWSKPGERTPMELLAELHGRAQDTPVRVFLADSGHYEAHIAKVAAIEFAEEPFVCGEQELTPEYYRDRACGAWFKLIDIAKDPIEEGDLRRYSYEELESEKFIHDSSGRAYDGKRVFGLTEMLERKHRTMYFLRDFQVGDEDHEVMLAPVVVPENLNHQERYRPSPHIVQISDPHFGFHAFPPPVDQGLTGDKPLAQRVLADWEDAHKFTPPALVVVSGDFTTQNGREGFDQAAQFLHHLRQGWNLEWSDFVTIPGNHDVTWQDVLAANTVDHEDQAVEAATVEAPPVAAVVAETDAPEIPEVIERVRVERPGPEAFAEYRRFVKETTDLEPAEDLVSLRRVVLANYVPVDVLAISSCALIQEGYSTFGWVDVPELRNIVTRAEVGWGGARKTRRRVVVLHHHPLPVDPWVAMEYNPELTLLTNAKEFLDEMLDLRVDIVMHGHTHRHSCSVYGNGQQQLVVAAAGSAGVRPKERPDGEPNSYRWMRFEDSSVHVWDRLIARDRHEPIGEETVFPLEPLDR